jgi:predicted RNA-binding protein with PUA-like domain
MFWLLKTEPSEYAFEDLVREKKTVWEGVKNPLAVRHLGSMKAGDAVVVYHTGSVRAAVGTARVVFVDARDPKAPRVVVAAGAPLRAPVSLGAIKASPAFRGSPLLSMGRLSVVPLTAGQHAALVTAG